MCSYMGDVLVTKRFAEMLMLLMQLLKYLKDVSSPHNPRPAAPLWLCIPVQHDL